MKYIVLIIGVIMILGPLRRPFFRNWRFSIPATLAGYLSWVFMYGSMMPHDPWWMPFTVALFVALGAGAAGKEWLDNVFGRKD